MLRVLLEGHADLPVLREVLVRRFDLAENKDFRLMPHRGKGQLPLDLLGRPAANRLGLLDQLPAKLLGFHSLSTTDAVVVVLDADDEPCVQLLARLNAMLGRLPRRPPRVLFRIAIEETESWFIADIDATTTAYPKCKKEVLRRIRPDAVVGAAEKLDKALGGPGMAVPGAVKLDRARRIAPHLDLVAPRSPSLAKLIEGIDRVLQRSVASPVG